MPRFKNSWSIGYGVTIYVMDSATKKYALSGKHSFGTYKLILTNNDVNETPKPKTSIIQIPGSSKLIDLSEVISGLPTYEGRKLKFNFAGQNDPETWPARYSKFLNEVHGRRVKLVLDNDRLWYYTGRADVSGFDRKTEIGTFKMDAECDPFKYFLYGIGDPWKWDDFMFGGIGWLIFVTDKKSYGFLANDFDYSDSLIDQLDLNSDGELGISDARLHLRIEDSLDPPIDGKSTHPNTESEGQYQSNVIMNYNRVYKPLVALEHNPYINGYTIDKETGNVIDASDGDLSSNYHVQLYSLPDNETLINEAEETTGYSITGRTIYVSGRIRGRTSLYSLGYFNGSTLPNDFTPRIWDRLSGKLNKEHGFGYRLSPSNNGSTPDNLLIVGYYGDEPPEVGVEVCPAYIDYKKDLTQETETSLTPTERASQRNVYCTYYDFVNQKGDTISYSVHGLDIDDATEDNPVDVNIYAPYDNVRNFYSDSEIQDMRRYYDNDSLALVPTIPEFQFTATNVHTDKLVVQKLIDGVVVIGADNEFVMSIPEDAGVFNLKFMWPEFILGNDDHKNVNGVYEQHSRHITLRFIGTGNVKINYTPRML